MFNDFEHRTRIEDLGYFWTELEEIAALARQYQIYDLAQDNNLKLLQTLILFDFSNQPDREGSDAIDCYGHYWELKTVNQELTHSFSTNHHTTYARIEAFRKERWLFSVYSNLTLCEAYAVSPNDLEPYFSAWESRLENLSENGDSNPHINNPKIPIRYIQEHGVLVFPKTPPINPADVLRYI